MRIRALLFLSLCAISSLLARAQPEFAKANDNRLATGVLNNGTLILHLEIRQALFVPDMDDGPNTLVHAFAEQGHTAQIPGPLIRVQRNTKIRVTVRNLLSRTVYVHGLHDRPYSGQERLVLPAGETKEVSFHSGDDGTYFYWASTTDCAIADRAPEDTELSGALIVDPPGVTPTDRAFVIGLWHADTPGGSEVLTVNGKSWPFTERFSMQVGDKIDWRWINPSGSEHAMHLHGFFFEVTSMGSEDKDQILDLAEQKRVVTQLVPSGGTFRMSWSPERAGNWLFHCHMTAHMAPHGPMQSRGGDKTETESHFDHMGASGMGGLVLGIRVKGAPESTSSPLAPRKLKLVVRERPATDEFLRGYSFDSPDGDRDTPTDKLPLYGDPLVLTEGEPVEITVTNKLKQPTAVHWHGIELESFYDGVPGWTGDARQTTPPILPGTSFVARMTPPRAGTFIYHTHWHDSGQLTGGLYGALVVVEPGKKFDPNTDKIFILARTGTVPGHRKLVINGDPQPLPTVLQVGGVYRFRLINITPNDADATFTLQQGNAPVRWRWIGKDGQMFKPDQVVELDAKQSVTVGETYDFEFKPEKPGTLVLVGFAPAQLQWVHAPIVVEAPKK